MNEFNVLKWDYNNEKAKLHKGDCLAFMQEMINHNIKVNAIITDPPYMMFNEKVQKLDKKFNEELFFELCGKITDKIIFFGRGDSFYKWNLLAKEQGFIFKEELIWYKNNCSSPLNVLGRNHETISLRIKKGYKLDNKVYISLGKKGFKNNKDLAELDDYLNCLLSEFRKNHFENSNIYKFLKGIKVFKKRASRNYLVHDDSLKLELNKNYSKIQTIERGFRLNSVIPCNIETHVDHPTQKPTLLLRYLVRLISDEGDLIFDPFTGSGSTGLGALLEQRKFLGCELNDEYFNLAKKRIDTHIREVLF